MSWRVRSRHICPSRHIHMSWRSLHMSWRYVLTNMSLNTYTYMCSTHISRHYVPQHICLHDILSIDWRAIDTCMTYPHNTTLLMSWGTFYMSWRSSMSWSVCLEISSWYVLRLVDICPEEHMCWLYALHICLEAIFFVCLEVIYWNMSWNDFFHMSWKKKPMYWSYVLKNSFLQHRVLAHRHY